MATDSIYCAFWNVENLFDTEQADRPERIRKLIAKDIVGWNDSLLNSKIQQLSKVIISMNSGKGPDILGVCEIENDHVLMKLTDTIVLSGGRKYLIAHADTSDNRGIDIAFLYDPDLATTTPDQMFQHWVVKRYATRELFQVNFTINERKLVIVGNHWPSRTSGQYESEPYRIVTGETLSYWIERIHEELGKDIAIVVMGDFNDDPFNRSLTEYALSSNNSRVVLNGRNNYLYNLMWDILATGKGSHLFKGQWNMLDQILVNSPILNGKSGFKIVEKAKLEGTTLMADPKNFGPRRFGIRPNERCTEGFSDHFPISVTIKVE